MTAVRIFGLKFERYREWIGVVLASSGCAGWEWYSDAEHGARLARAIVRMAGAVWSGRVDRGRWRARLRFGCGRCPVRVGRVCEVVDGDRVFGCGCYTPFKAMARAPYRGGCWVREHAPGSGLGWGSS